MMLADEPLALLIFVETAQLSAHQASLARGGRQLCKG